jgi:hypothetical protein
LVISFYNLPINGVTPTFPTKPTLTIKTVDFTNL